MFNHLEILPCFCFSALSKVQDKNDSITSLQPKNTGTGNKILLRNKIHYDLVKLKSKGVNWVENLLNYMQVLNVLAREMLRLESPFEVYYGRKSNVASKASHKNDKTMSWMSTFNEPTSP